MYSLANLIIGGHTAEVQSLLKQGVDPNQMDEYGYTPLIEAAISNDVEMAKILVAAGADVNEKDMTGGTALHWAVENNNLDFCNFLFSKGADANTYSRGSEAPLVKAMLRRQRRLQRLLLDQGADGHFADDFIYTKLLAHRYELKGHVDIVDARGEFAEVNLEGFFLESTLGLVSSSLLSYVNNYATKNLKHYFSDIKAVVLSLERAQDLQRYLQYQEDRSRHQREIQSIFSHPLLILPLGSAGHATTLVIKDQWLALCDRRKDDQYLKGIVIYKMKNKGALTKTFLSQLAFQKKPENFFNDMVVPKLKLEYYRRILIEPQMTGNCSWANVEASIPAALFLLREVPFSETSRVVDYQHETIQLFRHWREWDKKRALHFMLHGFSEMSPARRASRGALLALLVFQRCYHQSSDDLQTARRIVHLLKEYKLDYTLETYIQTYTRNKITKAGSQFKELLAHIEDELDG